MIFLISLALTGLFIRFCARSLKQHPVPYYAGAVLLAAAVVLCTYGGVHFPGWFSTWVWPIFARCALSTALFAAVMYAGAVPNGSKFMKTIMPIRGELSILASILTLGHNIAYGKTYFRLLFTRPERLPMNQLLAAVCSLAMLCIMLPLFITSFKCVRRKMKARSWKKLQRLAYGFYALIYVHVLLLTLPAARKGSLSSLLTAAVYSLVFLTYAAMRAGKALRAQPAPVRRAPAIAAILTLLLVMGTAAAPMLRPAAPQPDGSQSAQTPETPDVSQDEDSASAPLPDADADLSQDGGEDGSQPEPPEPAPEVPVTEDPGQSASTPDTTPVGSPTQTPEPAPAAPPAPSQVPEQPAPQPEPEPEVTYQYQNGTFTGSGEGFEGTITVSVTLDKDKITAITVLSSSDDEPYWSEGKAVIDRILSAQSTNVDTVSGATFSSEGILLAVKAALASAKN